MNSLPFGLWGEEIAAEYLRNKGYIILERHFYFHHTEIDLIARDGNYLVFIEVKTRSSADFGLPEEALTPRKKQYLRRAAEGYLYLNNLYNLDCRFDVISISLDQAEQPQIEHLENAFE
ncbi:MAG TPA: YraN family protein [Candidatus Aminicenantes bacterium]|nr:MAG: YraN family protein [Candidatus Aminicenantes bacterium]HEK86687.1 YraN family protein [Candidatus Aminicenantes bacterium]